MNIPHSYMRLYPQDNHKKSTLLLKDKFYFKDFSLSSKIEDVDKSETLSDESSLYSEMPREVRFMKNQKNNLRQRKRKDRERRDKFVQEQFFNSTTARSANALIRSMTNRNDFRPSKLPIQSKSRVGVEQNDKHQFSSLGVRKGTNHLKREEKSQDDASQSQGQGANLSFLNLTLPHPEDKRFSLLPGTLFRKRTSLLKVLFDKHKSNLEKLQRIRQNQKLQMSEKERLKESLDHSLTMSAEELSDKQVILKIKQMAIDEQRQKKAHQERLIEFKAKLFKLQHREKALLKDGSNQEGQIRVRVVQSRRQLKRDYSAPGMGDIKVESLDGLKPESVNGENVKSCLYIFLMKDSQQEEQGGEMIRTATEKLKVKLKQIIKDAQKNHKYRKLKETSPSRS